MTATTTLTGTNSGTECVLARTPELPDDLGQPYRELYEHKREGFAYCQMIRVLSASLRDDG